MGRITADIKVKESMLEEAKRLVSEKKVFLEEVIIGYCRFMHGTEMAGEAGGLIYRIRVFGQLPVCLAGMLFYR